MIFTGERQPREAITSFWANVDPDIIIRDDLKPECRKVHTDRPTAIKAGDPLGYLGIYQTPDDDGNAYSRQQMHFEIFTPDGEMVDYLLNNPLGLTRGKQYLRLTKGMVLMLPGTEGQTTESYTLRFDHAVPLEGLKTEEHNGKTWYVIDVEGQRGRIEKTDNLEIVSQHDGAKLGFQIVREDDPNHDGFLDPELISGVFLEIYKAIDADGNRQLSVEELVAAKDNPVLKEVWSKLIAHHPTEWRNHNGTARRLSEMLTDPDIPPEDREYCNNLLPQELVRMQALSFWDRLNPRLPESSYCFHPVRFVEFAATKRHPVIIIDGKEVELEFLELNDGEPISEEEYANIAASIGCEVAVVKAVAKVESGSQGPFFNFNGWDRVPTILFERHIFHRYTNGIYSVEENRNISQRNQSIKSADRLEINGYWASRYQYQRLLKAYALDKKAALMSASWGRFQLMGFNYAIVPDINSVEDMVRKFSESEKWHFKGLVGYVNSNSRLRNALRNKDWSAAALGYNGPNALAPKVRYDLKLEEAYNAFK